MSHTNIQEQTPTPTTIQRVNFSDDNRSLHLQAFFQWLPEEFHEMPLIDWTRLPSKVIGYLVNTVGDSPFALPLAIAAFAGVGPMKEHGLQHRLTGLNCLLREVQVRCGVRSIAGLTSTAWETYVAGKELTPADYAYFKAYA